MIPWTCPKCGRKHPVKLEGGRIIVPRCCTTPATAKLLGLLEPTRASYAAEMQLYADLREAGFLDLFDLGGTLEAVEHPVVFAVVFVPQFAWGWYLTPTRGFASDFAFPVLRVLVEIDGGAHAATRDKVQSDTERRGLAAAAGWIVVAVTPDQVRDGEAIGLVKEALKNTTRRK